MKQQTDKNELVHGHEQKLQSAVSWLGDRYLLAEPAQRLNEERKSHFAQLQSWHPATRRAG